MDEVKARIVSGTYSPGDKLPSVRELAVEAGVNPNTMQKAMSELERTGLVISNRTQGRFVTEDEKVLKSIRKDNLETVLNDFFKTMENLGYTREDVKKIVKDY